MLLGPVQPIIKKRSEGEQKSSRCLSPSGGPARTLAAALRCPCAGILGDGRCSGDDIGARLRLYGEASTQRGWYGRSWRRAAQVRKEDSEGRPGQSQSDSVGRQPAPRPAYPSTKPSPQRVSLVPRYGTVCPALIERADGNVRRPAVRSGLGAHWAAGTVDCHREPGSTTRSGPAELTWHTGMA